MEKPVSIFDAHVDTTMTTGMAKIIIPRCTMKAVAFNKIHGPGDILDVVSWASHASGFQLDVDFVVAGDRREGGYSCSDNKFRVSKDTIFEGVGSLSGEDDDDLSTNQDGRFRYDYWYGANI